MTCAFPPLAAEARTAAQPNSQRSRSALSRGHIAASQDLPTCKSYVRYAAAASTEHHTHTCIECTALATPSGLSWSHQMRRRRCEITVLLVTLRYNWRMVVQCTESMLSGAL
jgi:hypothetical protein